MLVLFSLYLPWLCHRSAPRHTHLSGCHLLSIFFTLLGRTWHVTHNSTYGPPPHFSLYNSLHPPQSFFTCFPTMPSLLYTVPFLFIQKLGISISRSNVKAYHCKKGKTCKTCFPLTLHALPDCSRCGRWALTVPGVEDEPFTHCLTVPGVEDEQCGPVRDCALRRAPQWVSACMQKALGGCRVLATRPWRQRHPQDKRAQFAAALQARLNLQGLLLCSFVSSIHLLFKACILAKSKCCRKADLFVALLMTAMKNVCVLQVWHLHGRDAARSPRSFGIQPQEIVLTF
jgi:hypothetical protein